VGAGEKKYKNAAKALINHCKKAGRTPSAKICEFKITQDAIIPVGTRIYPLHFMPDQFVDVTGYTKGRGFQGVMKRWGFSGQPASHGVSLTHRSLGSTGQRQDPGKVFKGKKMPGRMGGKRVTARNLRVFRCDPTRDLLFVIGSVPGGAGSWVEIKDSPYMPHYNSPPFPTYYPMPNKIFETITAYARPTKWDLGAFVEKFKKKLAPAHYERVFGNYLRFEKIWVEFLKGEGREFKRINYEEFEDEMDIAGPTKNEGGAKKKETASAPKTKGKK